MAQAIASGLLRAGHAPDAMAVADPAAAQRAHWARLHPAITCTLANATVAADAAVLVLAVKPQIMPTVLAELSASPRPAGQFIMSVAAGVTLASIATGLEADTAVVRVMPNQPALIGAGIAVMVASPKVNAAQRAQALYVAETTGKALWISDESLMDAVTAVSGSGPAYFYLVMELMAQSATEMGLPRDVAQALVRHTALGAARVASDPHTDLAALRASVTSPGGTTAAALAVLEQAGIADILRRALIAARDRSAELGRKSR